jgi:hypothetical protein
MSGFTQMPKGIENHLKMYLENSFQKKKKEKSYFSLPSLLLVRWPFSPLGLARPAGCFQSRRLACARLLPLHLAGPARTIFARQALLRLLSSSEPLTA